MAITIPKVQTTDRNINQLQENITKGLQLVLDNPTVIGHVLPSVRLSAGANTVNHLLDRNLQGWYITRMRGLFSQVFDTQDANPTPSLTLLLNSAGDVTVDIYVY